MPQEHNTIIVSVNTELDEEARFAHIARQVGEGWRVQTAIPLSGGELGPGGDSDQFLRMEVHLVRDVDENNVIVQGAPAEGEDAHDSFLDDATDADTPDTGAPDASAPGAPSAG